MEQHSVPQHIASFEFKLFGNLTVRQFITLAIPMSLAVAVYFSQLPAIIRLPLALIIGLFALFAALVPIGGRPFDKWIVAFIKAITSPTQRIWIKETKLPEFLSVVVAPPPTEEHIPESITAQGRARLREYLRSLPKGEVTPLDVKEQIAVQRLDLESAAEGLPSEALSGVEGAKEGKLPPPIIWPSSRPFTQISLPQINIAPKLTSASRDSLSVLDAWRAQTPPPETFQGQLETALPPTAPPPHVTAHPKISTSAKPFALPGLEKKLKEESQVVELSPTQPLIKAQLASEANATVESVIPIRTPDKQIKFIHGVGRTRVRKLHFAPPVGFDLSKLSIRGEKRFEISEELKKRYGSTESLFNETPFTVHSQTNTQPTGHTPKPSTVNREPTTELPHVPKSVPQPTKTMLSPQDVSLKKEHVAPTDSQIAIGAQKSKDLPLPSTQLSKAQIVPLTNKPNVISGIVTNNRKEPLENVILVIKNITGIPVRALKTNKLGQFLSVTPLAEGSYTIEFESDLAKFDPLALNLTGQILSPLEITAKGDA